MGDLDYLIQTKLAMLLCKGGLFWEYRENGLVQLGKDYIMIEKIKNMFFSWLERVLPYGKYVIIIVHSVSAVCQILSRSGTNLYLCTWLVHYQRCANTVCMIWASLLCFNNANYKTNKCSCQYFLRTFVCISFSKTILRTPLGLIL